MHLSTSSASSLRQELKRETAALHRRLEAQLGLLEPQLSIRRYRRVLETFYGFYAPVEVCLSRLVAADSPSSFPLPLRNRAALIENDLHALGLASHELVELPRCTAVPRLQSSENLAGCLYVLEGACLGGQMIARMLDRKLGVKRESGSSFFVGDGEGTSMRWRLVLSWLEGLADGGAHREQIVVSAQECFLTLSRWVKQQGASL